MESDETLEPPLCSCRMETPRNQDVVTLAEGKCMAVEGVDGKVSFDFLYVSLPLSAAHFLHLVSLYFRFLLPVYCAFHIFSPHTAEFMSKTHPEAGDDAAVSADPVAGAV